MFCFLLTTRVGGLGVNLTGANRVMLYDPGVGGWEGCGQELLGVGGGCSALDDGPGATLEQ